MSGEFEISRVPVNAVHRANLANGRVPGTCSMGWGHEHVLLYVIVAMATGPWTLKLSTIWKVIILRTRWRKMVKRQV